MIPLSFKAKESIKTALAMTIAYGIALSMDWDRPYWAAFAVAFISLATLGQSMNKGAMRMFGTLVTTVVALTLIALFAQDRWFFMVFLSAYIGFCSYMMSGTKNQYFWHVCGFVCVIICMDGGSDPVNAFATAVLRAQETGLGILVYSLVAIFLWPSSSRADFDAATVNLSSAQHQLFKAYFAGMCAGGNTGEMQKLEAQAVQAQSRFDQLLVAAETDSYDVWELRGLWRRYRQQTLALTEAMERWREGFTGLQAINIEQLLPGLKAYQAELELRFAETEGMLNNREPERKPTAFDLDLDAVAVRTLSHFQKAAVVVIRSRLQLLERLSCEQFETIVAIKGFGPSAPASESDPGPPTGFGIDPERLAGAIRIVATLWLAFLALIYISDLPGGPGFLSMVTPFGMAMVTMPQVSVVNLFKPVAFSVLFGCLIYIFVMPHLSSFWGLGPLIFACTFAICYLLAAPRQALGRVFGLAMFVTIASISNEQSYNFLSVTTTALMFVMLFVLLAVTAHIPFSPQPERVFLRLLRRFFRSSAFLMAAMRRDRRRPATRPYEWKRAFHAREVATLPRKLGIWAPHIDTRRLSDTTPQQVQAMVTCLQGISYRMQALHAERHTSQAQHLVEELLTDFRAWRRRVQETFNGLAQDPATGDPQAFKAGLAEIVTRLEVRIKETLDQTTEEQVSAREGEHFYRLLGGYRGVSGALVDYAGASGAIDWVGWQEERF